MHLSRLCVALIYVCDSAGNAASTFPTFPVQITASTEPLTESDIIFKTLPSIFPLINLSTAHSRVRRDDQTSPTLTCELNLIRFHAQQNVTIVCRLLSNASIENAIWTLNNQKTLTSNDEKCQLYVRYQNAVIFKLVDARRTDEGTYYCTATSRNQDGSLASATASVILKVIPEPPTVQPLVTAKHFDSGLEVGDSVEIECRVHEGSDKISITWLKDGQELEIERVFFTANRWNQENGILHINDLVHDDRAEYTCFASNSVGNHSLLILLRVRNPLRWLWPLIALLVVTAVLVVMLAAEDWQKRKRPPGSSREEPSDYALPTHPLRVSLTELPIPIPEIPATAAQYPASIIAAVIKWRSRVAARKEMEHHAVA